jgi:hypothetical protein
MADAITREAFDRFNRMGGPRYTVVKYPQSSLTLTIIRPSRPTRACVPTPQTVNAMSLSRLLASMGNRMPAQTLFTNPCLKRLSVAANLARIITASARHQVTFGYPLSGCRVRSLTLRVHCRIPSPTAQAS